MEIRDANVIIHTTLGDGEKFELFSMGERTYVGGKDPWVCISGWHCLANQLNANRFILIGRRIITTGSIVNVELLDEPEREVSDT